MSVSGFSASHSICDDSTGRFSQYELCMCAIQEHDNIENAAAACDAKLPTEQGVQGVQLAAGEEDTSHRYKRGGSAACSVIHNRAWRSR